jgi:hypothetical protein
MSLRQVFGSPAGKAGVIIVVLNELRGAAVVAGLVWTWLHHA